MEIRKGNVMTKKQIESLTTAVTEAVVLAIRDSVEQAQLRAIHSEPNPLKRLMTKHEFQTFMTRGDSLQPNGHDKEGVKFL